MAKIVRRETRKRGFFGWIFLLLFLGFNALMVRWLVSYWSAISDGPSSAGHAIGATIGTGMIFFFWTAGAVITGLFALLTRGRKTYIEESVELPEAARRKGKWTFGVAALGIVVGFGIIFALPDRREARSLDKQEAVAAAAQKAAALRTPAGALPLVTLDSYQWSKSDFGVMTATFTVSNRNEFDVKDIEVRCEHRAPSGTMIDSNNRTIYEIFRARSVRQIRDFNMGFIHSQIHTSACQVIKVTPL